MSTRERFLRGLAAALLFTFLLLAGLELLNLGWGSGRWLGRLSSKWALALAGYLLLASALQALWLVALYKPESLTRYKSRLIDMRARLGAWRWLLATLVLLAPAAFLFFTSWGGLFTSIFARSLLFLLALVMGTFSLTRDGAIWSWAALLRAGLVIGSGLALAESLVLVSDYPFALHWSEGNRLWDYSVLFGREIYDYPGGEIPALIDRGRQALWGMPFLIPGVSITAVRLWGALLVTLPYALLGWVAFRPNEERREQWLLTGLWAMIFLNQGPIYTPLVLSAILVAGVRRKPLWLALPVVYLAGHYAGLSRFTWNFAPAMWAAFLIIGDAVMQRGRTNWQDWLRAAALALAGIWSKGLPILLGVLEGFAAGLTTPGAANTPVATSPAGATMDPAATPPPESVDSLTNLIATSTDQPFLWSRLWPNEVYGPGIVLGLALATLPLILLMIYAIRRGIWRVSIPQLVVTAGSLLAFLTVGLIASAKVGGGTDLHNMDMFLVGLVLVAALAWEAGVHARLAEWLRAAPYPRMLLAAIVLIPAFAPIFEARPLDLPDGERVEFVLNAIQDRVACASQHGEVLFMDQRQLLTFGQIQDVELVAEYEKKVVMNEALASNEAYFAELHEDLAAGRFALIVTERQAILYKEDDEDRVGDSLVEENNAWVFWVTEPLLESYESIANYRDVSVELFMPLDRDFDCP